MCDEPLTKLICLPDLRTLLAYLRENKIHIPIDMKTMRIEAQGGKKVLQFSVVRSGADVQMLRGRKFDKIDASLIKPQLQCDVMRLLKVEQCEE